MLLQAPEANKLHCAERSEEALGGGRKEVGMRHFKAGGE